MKSQEEYVKQKDKDAKYRTQRNTVFKDIGGRKYSQGLFREVEGKYSYQEEVLSHKPLEERVTIKRKKCQDSLRLQGTLSSTLSTMDTSKPNYSTEKAVSNIDKYMHTYIHTQIGTEINEKYAIYPNLSICKINFNNSVRLGFMV